VLVLEVVQETEAVLLLLLLRLFASPVVVCDDVAWSADRGTWEGCFLMRHGRGFRGIARLLYRFTYGVSFGCSWPPWAAAGSALSPVRSHSHLRYSCGA
jgi:hypothetical protein